MKSLVNLSLNLVFTIVPCGIALAVADEALKETPAVTALDVNAPELWTSQPVVVTDKLAYERVPGVQYAESKPQPVASYEIAGSRPFKERSEILQEAVRPATVDTAGIEACSNRYRSYRVEDNTYQPFDGGPRRVCALRQDGAETADMQKAATYASTQVMDDATDPMQVQPAHAEWCMSRYRSYDAATNSYQPFSGGRRICVSPYN